MSAESSHDGTTWTGRIRRALADRRATRADRRARRRAKSFTDPADHRRDMVSRQGGYFTKKP